MLLGPTGGVLDREPGREWLGTGELVVVVGVARWRYGGRAEACWRGGAWTAGTGMRRESI